MKVLTHAPRTTLLHSSPEDSSKDIQEYASAPRGEKKKKSRMEYNYNLCPSLCIISAHHRVVLLQSPILECENVLSKMSQFFSSNMILTDIL